MDNIDKINFLKEYHQFEYSRKVDLSNHVSLPITLLTVIGAGIIFILTNISSIFKVEYKYFTMGSCLISLLLFIISIIWICRYYFGHEYCFIPKPKDVINDVNKLANRYNDPFYNNLSQTDKDKRIKEDESELFIEYYVEAVEHNIKTNDKKSELLHNSNVFVFLSLLILFISSVGYFIGYLNYASEKSQKVEIINKSFQVQLSNK